MPSGGLIYPGIQGTISWSFTLSQGINPSTGFIEIPAGRGLPREEGDLTLWYQDQRITLRNCRIGNAAYSSSRGGKKITLQILDRRWKWQFGRISGLYNRRRPDETIDPETEATPQELAEKLLRAMGESTFSVSALPNFSRPEIDWAAANPAQELLKLCEGLGCRIVLGLDDVVRIVRQGQGLSLPSGGTLSRGDGIDPNERPDALVCIGSPTRYQCRLLLEAVGLDVDEVIVPIDNLTYRPDGGWEKEWPEVMAGVSDREITLRDGTKTTPRKLALQTVFRWYRVLNGQSIPELKPDRQIFREDVIPLPTTLVDTYEDAEGVKREKPAYVIGEAWYDELDTYENTAIGTRINLPFSINSERAVVEFSKPLVTLDVEAGESLPARIELVAAVAVNDPETRQPQRYERTRPLTSAGAGSKIVRPIIREEIRQTFVASYDDSGRVSEVTENTKDIEKEADYYLDGIVAEYTSPVTDDRTYPGILPIPVDGAIEQVTWNYSGQWTTRASRGTEHNLARPTYKQFVAMQEMSEAAREQSRAESLRARRAERRAVK